MSHFTVLVISDNQNYEQDLAPYDENLEVPQYIKYTKQDCINQQREWNIRKHERDLKQQGLLGDSQHVAGTSLEITWSDEDLYNQYREENDWADFDEDGNELSAYNPLAKWDWYSLGGRWMGSLSVRPEYIKQGTKDLEEVYKKINTQKQIRAMFMMYGHELTNAQDIPSLLKALTKLFHPDLNKGIDNSLQAMVNKMSANYKAGHDISYEFKLFTQELDKLMEEDLSTRIEDISHQIFTDDRIKAGEPGLFSSGQYPKGKCDSAPVKCVDFFAQDKDSVKFYTRFWEINVENSPKTEKEESEGDKWDSFYKSTYYVERYGDKDTYVKEMTTFTPYAILNHGEWIEPGEMGWFGMSSAGKEGYDEFRKRWEELVNSLNPEDFVSVIDCHI